MADSERFDDLTPRKDYMHFVEQFGPAGAGVLVLTHEFSGAGPRIAHADEQFLRLTGYAADDLASKALNQLIDPVLEPTALAELEQHLAGRLLWRSTTGLCSASSSLLAVDMMAAPLLDVAAARYFVVEFRRRLERDALLTIAERHCRAVTEANRDGLILLIAERDEADRVVGFRIADVNLRAAELFASEREALQGRELSQAATRLHSGECFQQWVAAVNTGRVLHATVPGSSLGMRAKWVRWHAVPTQIGLAVCLCDVSWERELSLQVARASRFESIGSLAVSIAHDFNNMLAAIIGFSELARDALPIHSTARVDVEQVIGAADRATRLTRYLLAFGSRQPLDPQLVNIGSSLSDLEPILGRLTGPSIDVSLQVAGSLPIWVDSGQMEQAIVNLVVNARDAMPHGGVLRIRAAAVQVVQGGRECTRGCEPGEYACISVEDNGIGMDERIRERIFEPFFTTKAEQGGTGLGLASTYGFVKQSGGTILVDTEKGRGTTIHLYFPLARVVRRPSSIPAPSMSGPMARNAATILLVEVDEHVRNVTRRVLQSNKYVVVEASNSEDAERQLELQRESPDLLLSAMRLPGGTGLDLARCIRQRHPRIGVVLMSGAADMHDIEQASERLGALFVQKPFTAATLVSTIQNALATTRRGKTDLCSGDAP